MAQKPIKYIMYQEFSNSRGWIRRRWSSFCVPQGCEIDNYIYFSNAYIIRILNTENASKIDKHNIWDKFLVHNGTVPIICYLQMATFNILKPYIMWQTLVVSVTEKSSKKWWYTVNINSYLLSSSLLLLTTVDRKSLYFYKKYAK